MTQLRMTESESKQLLHNARLAGIAHGTEPDFLTKIAEQLTSVIPKGASEAFNTIPKGAALAFDAASKATQFGSRKVREALPPDIVAVLDKVQPYIDKIGEGANMPGVIPAPPVGMFIGPKGASLFEKSMLRSAEHMEKTGFRPEDIRQQTGWMRGLSEHDKNWRMEISDKDMGITPAAEAKFPASWPDPPLTTGEVVTHPDVYNRYPDIKDIPIEGTGWNFGISGGYAHEPAPKFYLSSAKDTERASSIMGHEFQHRLQEAEGFHPGANSSAMLPDRFRDVLGDLNSRKMAITDAKGFKTFLDKVETKYNVNISEGDMLRYLKPYDSLEAKKIIGRAKVPTGESFIEKYPVLTEERHNEIQKSLRRHSGVRELAKLEPEIKYLDSIESRANEYYRTNPGEMEAREVQRRLRMTPEERKATAPYGPRTKDEGYGPGYSSKEELDPANWKSVPDKTVPEDIRAAWNHFLERTGYIPGLTERAWPKPPEPLGLPGIDESSKSAAFNTAARRRKGK